MRILGIETSCDDTAVAVVEAKGGARKPQFKIVKNIISSQVEAHRPFGGVVPNIAKREHIKNLPILLKKVGSLKSIDAIAVTVGPGLDPALWTGIEFARDLSKKIKKPLIGVNHLEGHLYSSWIKPTRQITKIEFPAIALIVSGGHTILLKMTSISKWKKLGETRDDAAGEAYDKVARMLKLPYPGGPEIERLSKKGNPKAIDFPRPMFHAKNYDFSFSGLKTSVLYYLRNLQLKTYNLQLKSDIAASFQAAVIDSLSRKVERAIVAEKAKSLILSGGVASNKILRRELRKIAQKNKAQFFTPKISLNTDNAAMIAVAGYIDHLSKKKRKITSQPHLTL
jgi:N6-L-threonylcarbamoyladenine synthase